MRVEKIGDHILQDLLEEVSIGLFEAGYKASFCRLIGKVKNPAGVFWCYDYPNWLY